MKRLVEGIGLLTIIALIFSCKKSVQSANNSIILGEWTWADTYFLNEIITPANSAVRKTLVFKPDNQVTLTHNDSIGQSFELGVLDTVSIKNTLVESEAFQTETQEAACFEISYSSLNIGNDQRVYQYSISGDSLYLQNPPCLGPLPSVYIRMK